ncbi:hypothetical protein LPU83_pLPU83d_1126 (plasmid) [Rhizobium favelukesii]|uniref:Uncharacterized protein n=1 Tax=Rhizobium favelukesii TaxID=348824 RepID=W6S8Q0_9HYPH|nr:hypothetical protein LPU83_pLPU83d_1126 [Rhizobium favelukesii]
MNAIEYQAGMNIDDMIGVADVRAHFERLARACLGQHSAGTG